MAQIQSTELNNLYFPPSFFEDEVREGFFISSMMKRYWAAQLKVLSVIDGICERHNLRWFADYGTLIGAVRHGGYIPWDDDLDICMFREDWNIFFEAAKKEAPESYKILTIRNTPGYEEITGRIINSSTINYSQKHLAENFGCPYTVGVDIFPLDGVYDDQEKENDRTQRAAALTSKLVDSNETQKRKLLLEIEEVYSECPCENAKNVALMPFFISSGNHIFPKELYENITRLSFEHTFVNAAARYDEILELDYGDFMKVNKSGGMHNYPVYAEQEKILKNNIGRNPYRYTIDYVELLTSVQRYVKRAASDIACQNIAPQKKSNHETVVFLPCKARWWHTMEPLWKQYSSNENTDVYVLPIFYYDCDYNGNIGEKHDERHLFPDYLNISDCEKFDFESIHPDKIFIQVPYDGWCTFMTVHEYFYSANLLRFTDELIYIPYMEMDAPISDGDKTSAAISVFIEQEAVINADRIILADEKTRNFYISHMTELCGNDTTAYWEQKAVLITDLVEKKYLENTKNELEKNNTGKSELSSLFENKDHKKILIYHITISFLLRGKEKSIDKLYRSLSVFEENGDKIIVVFLPQKQILDELPGIDNTLYKKYIDFIENMKKSKNCIYDEKNESENYIERWDAYYGDSSPYANKCVNLNIPVMLQSITI
ncbi:MAG: LicD family protein [Butyrivibrio sp.]|nr:LicD family protein [Butyrivibrio sp.]